MPRQRSDTITDIKGESLQPQLQPDVEPYQLIDDELTAVLADDSRANVSLRHVYQALGLDAQGHWWIYCGNHSGPGWAAAQF